RLDQLSTFGMLQGRPHAWVLDLLGALEAAGLIAAEGDEYPTLRLTTAGREVMHARQPPLVSWPQQRARARREPTARAKDPQSATPIDSPLFERLRRLRAKLAAEERLPAYCVFHDRTLAELCRARPASLDALARIPGVGPNKLAKYGEKFLAAIAEV